MEHEITSQNLRLDELEGKRPPSLHEMEVKELQRREDEEAKQDLYTDTTLESDLTNKYGVTSWAKKLIKEIIATRRLN
jgi:hypothetical protein